MTTAVANTENLASVDLKASIIEAVGKQTEGNQFDVSVSIAAINKVADEHARSRIDQAIFRISLMYALILRIKKSKQFLAAFNEERKRHQVQVAQNGSNEYYPFVRVMDGRWADPDEDTVTFEKVPDLRKWYPNKSSLKYATVIEELVARNIDPDEAEAFMLGFKHSETGKTRINGLIAASIERRQPAKRNRGDKWNKADQEAANKAFGLCKVPKEVADKLSHHNNFFLAIGRTVNGVSEIIGCSGLGGNVVTKAVKDQKAVWSKNVKPAS